jgi:hypothetical protein
MIDYREEMELATDSAAATLPREAYGAATFSLHYGTVGGGADMSWDDAIAALREWADSVHDWSIIGSEYDEESDDWNDYEVGSIDSRDIVAAVIGKELARYI